jgi:hypothetical protein
MSTDASGNDFKVSGGGAGFGIAVGGTVLPNLIVYGTILDSLAFGPTVKVSGVTSTASDNSAGVVGIGVGLAY